MTIKAFKVDTETLVLIDRYLKSNPEGHKNISKAIIKSITTLNETENGKHPMLEESSIALVVKPKKDYKKIVIKKYGKKGPYKVSKVVKSFAQTGEGFYTLEGSEGLFPTDWFQEVPQNKEGPRLSAILTLIIWGALLFSGGYSLGLLQYMYIFMLL